MRQDGFISRTNAVVQQMKVAFANFDVPLREERRGYWLASIDVFYNGVK